MPTLKYHKTKNGSPYIFIYEGKKKYRFSQRKNGEDYEEKAKLFLKELQSPAPKPMVSHTNEKEDELRIVSEDGEGVKVQTDYPTLKYNELFNNKESFTGVIIASSKAGKTTFIRELYSKIRPLYDIIIFISNSIDKPIYDFIPEDERVFTLDNYNPDLIKFLFKLQKSTKNYLRIAVICDDEISSSQDYQIKKLYAMGRNHNLSFFKSVQDYSFISRAARDNTNYLFLLKNNNCVEHIIDNFLRFAVDVPKKIYRVSDQKKYLAKWFKENTKDYQIICIDFLRNRIYKYKCQI